MHCVFVYRIQNRFTSMTIVGELKTQCIETQPVSVYWETLLESET